jgi:hypothetical protein
VLWHPLWLRRNNDTLFVSIANWFEGGSCYIWYFYLFPYQMIFVSLTNNSSGATSGEGTVHSTRHLVSAVVFSVVRVVKSFVFCVVFCWPMFVFLSSAFSYCIVYTSTYSFWSPSINGLMFYELIIYWFVLSETHFLSKSMNKHWRKPKRRSRMNNPEKLAISARQDTWRRQIMQNTQHTKPKRWVTRTSFDNCGTNALQIILI